MKSSKYSFLVIGFLFVLLGVMAWLQYVWLGQISEAESERMKTRLESDIKRFSNDFNREISRVYFSFLLTPSFSSEKTSVEVSQRYENWLSQTKFPKLIRDFYIVKKEESEVILQKYNFDSKVFEQDQWTPELLPLKEKLIVQSSTANSPDIRLDLIENVDSQLLALFLPLPSSFNSLTEEIKKVSPTEDIIERKGISLSVKSKMPTDFLIVKLDEETLKNEIVPSLVKTYFSTDGDNYRVEIAETQNPEKLVFLNNQNLSQGKFDISANFFSINRELNDVIVLQNSTSSPVKLNSTETINILRSEKKMQTSPIEVAPKLSNGKNLSLTINKGDFKTTSVLRTSLKPNDGIWTINIQHADGSLENFITKTRHRNLLVSFGILGLLAVSTGLIVTSSQRAKIFAQRQIDFVSAVSHEFRTPLAVIYSAGENLTDGVVNSPHQVANYGNLIKREGKKLSAMVEQILEFAGANSGRKKYDFQEVVVKNFIRKALSETETLVREKEVLLTTEGLETSTIVYADANALSQALQNLIVNAVKYSNADKRLHLSLRENGEFVEIAVKDYGRGIPAKELNRIFEPFYRVKEVIDAQIHGNGLGLSLVKQIVDAHKGKITVESKIGEGSKFTISLRRINFK